jgi:hypothetical protein
LLVTWMAAWCTARADLLELRAPINDMVLIA